MRGDSERNFLPVKLEKSNQVCLLLLPTMSQSLLWGFAFFRRCWWILHTGHSFLKGHITMCLSFLMLLYLREGDVGCQVAKGDRREEYWNWMTEGSLTEASVGEGRSFWASRWHLKCEWLEFFSRVLRCLGPMHVIAIFSLLMIIVNCLFQEQWLWWRLDAKCFM